jgi:hypothetical protein
MWDMQVICAIILVSVHPPCSPFALECLGHLSHYNYPTHYISMY